ncbi:Similar to tRNA (guanine(37)-N1)-methyltransferase; acc. no. D5GN29 [Pyronema omphalodes CBS 100304]|uniref:tRNA (guanine(37)-N1)-methyltransferase n=1 Tax=Pyronema omphalodes (strain CBS 100304) TaxID=1076935 RepID=U4LDP6_PYROM|nr:Similar to tRNA (guanine(37)-N1)-methyltransferase; acc. no. D5GN29 [Pyronema omphalodes CBS 100304]
MQISSPPTEEEMQRLFAPPVNRAMQTLDRSFFRRTIPLTAARIFNPKDISQIRRDCAQDLLRVRRIELMPYDPEDPKRKLLLLRPDIDAADPTTASEKTQSLIKNKALELVPYTLEMRYEHWNYDEIVGAVLPEGLDDVPGSFAQAGHLAHLNLRSQYLPYKHLLAQVILDKNPQIRTVVNKLEDVGTHSVFRTFPMEILAGPEDTTVEVKESACNFVFDFAKVYWNTRLSHEHERVVAKFQPGEAVCDVMAGVGPFAIPAGKKGVFVYANDLNPESYKAMLDNVSRNKVGAYVIPHNTDGRAFIRSSIEDLWKRHKDPAMNPAMVPGPPVKYSRSKAAEGIPQPRSEPKKVAVPRTFKHFVMNLPASAVEFLDAYRGCYKGLEEIFEDGTEMPLIHVHTFHRETQERGEEFAEEDILAEIKKYLGTEVPKGEVDVHNVRRVAPNKQMYCASFRLPKKAAFA